MKTIRFNSYDYSLNKDIFFVVVDADNNGVRINDSLTIGTGCSIAAGVVVEDNVTIGDNVTIARGCRIAAGVIIGDNVNIGEFCTIYEGVEITHDVHIGTHCGICSDVQQNVGNWVTVPYNWS